MIERYKVIEHIETTYTPTLPSRLWLLPTCLNDSKTGTKQPDVGMLRLLYHSRGDYLQLSDQHTVIEQFDGLTVAPVEITFIPLFHPGQFDKLSDHCTT